MPEGDVLVFGGDAGISRESHVQPFRRFLKAQPHSRKVVTFGNMDHWVEGPSSSPGAFPGVAVWHHAWNELSTFQRAESRLCLIDIRQGLWPCSVLLIK